MIRRYVAVCSRVGSIFGGLCKWPQIDADEVHDMHGMTVFLHILNYAANQRRVFTVLKLDVIYTILAIVQTRLKQTKKI